MRQFLIAFITGLSFACMVIGCSENKTQDSSASHDSDVVTNQKDTKIDDTSEHQILSSLESTNRNTVHVALWTLRSEDIETPAEIDLNSPYDQAEKHLKLLAEKIAKLDKSKLVELDKSLLEHWQIYSPIWGPSSSKWN